MPEPRAALGCEGVVSKRRGSSYRFAGRALAQGQERGSASGEAGGRRGLGQSYEVMGGANREAKQQAGVHDHQTYHDHEVTLADRFHLGRVSNV
jgi:hypothetical protein